MPSEVRAYAENPADGFLPTGKVLALREPTLPHVRVDSECRAVYSRRTCAPKAAVYSPPVVSPPGDDAAAATVHLG
jgi:hypothetical protein